MKKLFLILIPIMFISCAQPIRNNTNIVAPTLDSELLISSFIDLKLVCKANNPLGSKNSDIGGYNICIYVDKNTDVLYMRENAYYRASMTPIMKADGTCLTYSEWRHKNGM